MIAISFNINVEQYSTTISIIYNLYFFKDMLKYFEIFDKQIIIIYFICIITIHNNLRCIRIHNKINK